VTQIDNQYKKVVEPSFLYVKFIRDEQGYLVNDEKAKRNVDRRNNLKKFHDDRYDKVQ
jgi:hypothetical protein